MLFPRKVRMLFFTISIFLFLIPTASAAIDVNKTFAPSTVYPTEDTTLTILLQNSALTPVNNVNFTDTFPDDIFVSATPNITNTCAGTVLHSNTASGGLVTLSGGTIPAGDGTNPGTCSVSLSAYAAKAGSYINTIEIGSVTGDNGGFPESNTQISQGTLVAVIQDVSVSQHMTLGSLTGAISNALNGDEIGFHKIIFSNPNPVSLTNTSYSFNLNTNFTVFSDETSTTCGSGTIDISGNMVTFSGGTIPAKIGGTNGTCEVAVKVQNSRDITLPYLRRNTNVFFPASIINTQEGATNTTSSSTWFYLYSGMYIDRYYADGGTTQNYTIDINDTDTTRIRLHMRQYNTQDIANFSFDDTLPAGMNIVSIESNTCGGSLSGIGTNILSLTGSTLLAGVNENQAGAQSTTCDIYYTVQVNATGTYTTSIPAGDFSGYEYSSDNSSLTVTGNIFEVSMAFNRSIIYQGDTNRLTYTLTNRSKTRTVTNIDILNDLATMGTDSGVGNADTDPIFKVSNRYLSPTTSCSTGTIIAPVGATSISLQDFELAPESTCYVNVELTVDTDAVSPGYNYNASQQNFNTIPVGGITFEAGNGVETFATQVQAVTRTYRAINLYKSWTPNKVGPSGISRLLLRIGKISYDSNGVYNISLLDNLPTGFEVAADPQVQNGCGGTFSAVPGANSVSLSGGYMTLTSTSAYCYIYVNIKAKNLTPPNLTETHTNIIPGDTHGSTPVYFSADDGNGNPYENVQYNTSASLTIESIDLSVNTSFLQSNINGGAVSRVRTTISNLEPTSVPLTGVSLVDVLPAGVQLYSDVNPVFSDTNGSITGSCNGASFMGNPGDSSITLQDANIAANTLCYFEYNVTALVGGNHINTVEIGDIVSNEGITNSNSAASTLTVGRQVNVGKGFSPSIIEVGGTSTMTISIYNTQTSGNDETGTNVGNGDAQPALRDFIPSGITLIDTPVTTCSGGVVSTGSLAGQDYIELNGGLFAAESECRITATVQINTTGVYTDTIPRDNLFTVSGSQNPDEASAGIRVINKPIIATSFSPTYIPAGGISTIYYTLNNSSNSAATLPGGITGVQFSNTFTNMEIASPLTVGGSCQGVQYNAALGGNSFEVTDAKIPAGGSCSITVRVTSSTYGFHDNQTTGINSNETQTIGDPSNIATLTVLEPATITKSFSPTTVSTGQPTRLTFTLTNPNTLNSVSTIRFSDIFPVGMEVAPTPNISETCSGTPTVLDFNTATTATGGTTGIDIQGTGSIPTNSSCTIALDVVTTLGGTLVNTSSSLTTNAGTSTSGATATLTSLANTPPVITLTGSGTLTVEAGSTYTDAGATATDAQDGNLTSSITSSGSVNTSATGSYIIEYNVTDLGGMSATPVTRNVTVVDTTAPIISLTGSGTLTLEVGSSYTDLGATCTDNLDSPCPVVSSSGSVNTNLLGTYTLTYNVTDASGNIATQLSRTVNIVDTTKPVITISGSNPTQVYRNTSYSDAGATCSDNYDPTCSVTASGSVDTSTLGTYTITYTAIDSSGNTETVTRTVNVIAGDTPLLTLLGNNPHTHEVLTSYTDAGATANDTEDGDITSNITSSGSVNANVLGTYTLTYDVTDSQGNIATQVMRTVNVVDTIIPVISLTGSGTINHIRGYSYTDAGATAQDNYDGDISGNIVFTGSVDTATLGSYTLRYNISDSSGNAANEVTRTVNVVAGDTPVITLTGSGTLTLEVGSSYSDLGATASDSEDGDITANITSSGSVDTSTLGTYTLTYDVTDISGNVATQVTRTVNVVDTTKPVITLQGANSMQVYQNTAWTDPGYSCSDNYDTNCVVTASGSIDMATPGIYTFSYTATDSSGNIESIIRQVEVITGGIPIITLTGSGTLSLEVGSAYTDAGATASDLEDGDITTNISQTGSVNTNLLGTYILSYDVTDSHGNQAMQVIRTIDIVDTTAPVITNPNNTQIALLKGADFTLSEVTCNDNYDGVCNVVTTGTFNVDVLGTYTITYTATDSSGNIAQENVVITIKPNVGSTGGYDRCGPLGDLSGDSYDGICDAPEKEEETQEEVVEEVVEETTEEVIEEAEEKNEIEETIETPEEVVPKEEATQEENQENIEKKADNGSIYTLKNDFKSCKIIDFINDYTYTYTSQGVFIDEDISLFKDKILKFSEIGIVDGYKDGYFRPEKQMTRAEFLKVALISHCYEYRDLVGNTRYDDMTVGSWQAKVVQKAEELGMIHGYEDNTFQPDAFISKAEAIKILMRISYIYTDNPVDLSYRDINTPWHESYIRIGETLGLFDAQKDSYVFEPDSPVKREDIVDMIDRLVHFYR